MERPRPLNVTPQNLARLVRGVPGHYDDAGKPIAHARGVETEDETEDKEDETADGHLLHYKGCALPLDRRLALPKTSRWSPRGVASRVALRGCAPQRSLADRRSGSLGGRSCQQSLRPGRLVLGSEFVTSGQCFPSLTAAVASFTFQIPDSLRNGSSAS